MRAVHVTEPGGPEVLVPRETEPPVPGPGDVEVEVRATALNRADLLQREGRYPAPPGAPPTIPGLEYAGVVVRVGARAREVWRVEEGERVMGLLGGGGYAERVVAPAGLTLAVPERLDFVEAAAVPEVFLTAYDALVRQAGLGVGERALVHSAGGGVGTAALQVARAAGASLLVGTASGDKLRRIEEAGLPLDVGVDYEREDFADVVARETDGAGVDVILDTVGADYWDRNVASLGERGRMLLVGLLGGARATVDLGRLLRQRARVYGTVLRARSLGEKLRLVAEARSRLLPLLADGTLRPVVDRTFPLEEAADAHRYMSENRNFGKIVLEVG